MHDWCQDTRVAEAGRRVRFRDDHGAVRAMPAPLADMKTTG
jgi:hypothetical protein